jgi:hypothetical protein
MSAAAGRFVLPAALTLPNTGVLHRRPPQVFLTWEDIRDVKPKMIMTLVASIMQVAKERAAKAGAGAK